MFSDVMMTTESAAQDISSYCPEWQDEERMGVMFAPMRHKELNPESWNSKMLFWSSLISQWCLANNKCCVTLELLEQSLQRTLFSAGLWRNQNRKGFWKVGDSEERDICSTLCYKICEQNSCTSGISI